MLSYSLARPLLTLPVLKTIEQYDAAIAKTEAMVREWKRRRKTLVMRALTRKQHQDPAWVAHFKACRAAARQDPEKAARQASKARTAALKHWDQRGRLPAMTGAEYYRYRKNKRTMTRAEALAFALTPSAGSPPTSPAPRERARSVLTLPREQGAR